MTTKARKDGSTYKVFSVSLNEDTVTLLDKNCKTDGRSRSKYLEKLIKEDNDRLHPKKKKLSNQLS